MIALPVELRAPALQRSHPRSSARSAAALAVHAAARSAAYTGGSFARAVSAGGSSARRACSICACTASGPVPPIRTLDLTSAGSVFVTRPTLADYAATPEERQASAARLFAMIASGKVPVRIGARYKLRDAADAHRALESRTTTGSTLLIP